MIKFLGVWLVLMGVCTIPAIILGSIFHYYIKIYQLNYLLVLFITIVAIALTNALTFFLILYSGGKFEIYWLYLGILVSGICGFVASLIRVIWLDIRKINLNKGNETAKTILFFNFVAPTLMILMLIVVVVYDY